MKLPVLIILLSGFLFTLCNTKKHLVSNEFSLLEVKAKTLIPEGIAVHPITGTVYLSSLHENKIVSVDDKGVITDVISTGQQGFRWGLGMKFSDDGKVLWACSANDKGHTALYSINPGSGAIIKSYKHDSARFLNDLVILKDGRIFITDTEQGAVFLLHNDSLQLYLKDDQLKWANGITASPQELVLFVASGRYGVMRIDLTTKVISSAPGNTQIDYAIDGLVMHDNTLYAAIGWPQDSLHQHRIIRYYLDDKQNYLKADTLSINVKWLQCPTTLALHNHKLYALSTMNLGIYNRHKQQTDKILDSLQLPLVAVYSLAK